MEVLQNNKICLLKKGFGDKILVTSSSYIIFSHVEEKKFCGYCKLTSDPEELSFILDDIEDIMDQEYLNKNGFEKFSRIEWCEEKNVGYELF